MCGGGGAVLPPGATTAIQQPLTTPLSFPSPLSNRSKCKLYRFESDEWKERGIGQARLLRHKDNGKTRLLMRQEKTLKIRANHIGVCALCVACVRVFVWVLRVCA